MPHTASPRGPNSRKTVIFVFRSKDESYKCMRKLERRFLVCAVAAIALLNSGCLPAMIIDSHERGNWQQLNLEREKAGLQPVTWDEYHNHGMHM
jgi:hypothetical protein